MISVLIVSQGSICFAHSHSAVYDIPSRRSAERGPSNSDAKLFCRQPLDFRVLAQVIGCSCEAPNCIEEIPIDRRSKFWLNNFEEFGPLFASRTGPKERRYPIIKERSKCKSSELTIQSLQE